MTTKIADALAAAELATAGQASAAAAVRNAATIGNLVQGVTTPPSSPPATGAPGAVQAVQGG